MLLLAISLLLVHGASRPVKREPEDAIVGWVQDPNGRGTIGLILSCFLTLALCVWTAMHLNIPPKHESQAKYLLRNLKWAALGILIPELVVLAAWRQWLSARKMGKELQEIFKNRESLGFAPRRHAWTIEHSYFAGMGGFAFDAECLPAGKQCILTEPDRLTLTAAGVILLADCGHLPDIDRNSIWDKSKADGLSKALVCIQVTWMIGQTIGRVFARIPITLLEVNTLGHIFCAFVIYALWWRKPKQVRAPIILEGSWTTLLAAYMYMSSRISGKKLDGIVVLSKWIEPELHNFAWFPHKTVAFPDRSIEAIRESECGKVNQHEKLISPTAGVAQSGELRKLRTIPKKRKSDTLIKITTKQVLADEEHSIRMNRHAACSEAINLYPPLQRLFELHKSKNFYVPKLSHLVTDVATNWPSDFYLPGISGELMGMALWLSSTLYGGIHLAAWSDYFPTDVERLLWRFSAIFIASSGAFWFILCIIAFRWPFAGAYWDRFIELRAWKVEYVVLGAGATMCGLAYIFARVFLVAGAVISLRKLPNAAYQTPDWTTIFPHL